MGYTGQEGSKTGQIKFVTEGVSPPNQKKFESNAARRTGCYFCGKHGHIKAYCYKFKERVSRVKDQGKFFWNGYCSQIWIKKSDLYQGASESTSGRLGTRTLGSGHSHNMTATTTYIELAT